MKYKLIQLKVFLDKDKELLNWIRSNNIKPRDIKQFLEIIKQITANEKIVKPSELLSLFYKNNSNYNGVAFIPSEKILMQQTEPSTAEAIENGEIDVVSWEKQF
jgi:hypothetical protein